MLAVPLRTPAPSGVSLAPLTRRFGVSTPCRARPPRRPPSWASSAPDLDVRNSGAVRFPIPQRIDQQGEGGRGLPTAGVIEVIPREGLTPVLEHPHEPSIG